MCVPNGRHCRTYRLPFDLLLVLPLEIFFLFFLCFFVLTVARTISWRDAAALGPVLSDGRWVPGAGPERLLRIRAHVQVSRPGRRTHCRPQLLLQSFCYDAGRGRCCRKRLGTVLHKDQRSPCLLQFIEAVRFSLANPVSLLSLLSPLLVSPLSRLLFFPLSFLLSRLSLLSHALARRSRSNRSRLTNPSGGAGPSLPGADPCRLRIQ